MKAQSNCTRKGFYNRLLLEILQNFRDNFFSRVTLGETLKLKKVPPWTEILKVNHETLKQYIGDICSDLATKKPKS